MAYFENSFEILAKFVIPMFNTYRDFGALFVSLARAQYHAILTRLDFEACLGVGHALYSLSLTFGINFVVGDVSICSSRAYAVLAT